MEGEGPLVLTYEDFCCFAQLSYKVLSVSAIQRLSDVDLCGVLYWGKKYKTEAAELNWQRARNEFIIREVGVVEDND